jgi:hypothetical protein
MIRPLASLGNQNQAQPAWRYQGYELVIDIDPAVTCEDVSFSYRRHRFPPVVIQHAVWLSLRFTLSYRDGP